MRAYRTRNALLEGLGYPSYARYLRSALWKSIRERKLRRDKQCYACDQPAWQVHHSEYTYANLAGESQRGLYSVCGRCHRKAEFTRTGRKRTPKAATDMLKNWRRARLRRKRVPERKGVFRRITPQESAALRNL